MWGILPIRERLHKILPKLYKDPYCTLCKTVLVKNIEMLDRALMHCSANQGLPSLLLSMLRLHQPSLTSTKILTLDLEFEPSLELALTWITCSLLYSIWSQREEGIVCAAKTRAELEARGRLLREGKLRSLINAQALVSTSFRTLFG